MIKYKLLGIIDNLSAIGTKYQEIEDITITTSATYPITLASRAGVEVPPGIYIIERSIYNKGNFGSAILSMRVGSNSSGKYVRQYDMHNELLKMITIETISEKKTLTTQVTIDSCTSDTTVRVTTCATKIK